MGKNTGVGEEGPGGRAGSSGEGTVDLTELDAHGRERERALHSGNCRMFCYKCIVALGGALHWGVTAGGEARQRGRRHVLNGCACIIVKNLCALLVE